LLPERDGTVPREGRSARVGDREWPCPACGDIRIFTQPPCVDGHTDDGGQCPEWACVDCGTAFFAADLEVPASAPADRHAA
jgi:hypothetical protein